MVGIGEDIYAMVGEAVYSRGKCSRKNSGWGNNDRTKDIVPKKTLNNFLLDLNQSFFLILKYTMTQIKLYLCIVKYFFWAFKLLGEYLIFE